MKLEDIYQLKGKATSTFAYIEVLISLFITVHYFGSKNEPFIEEVLEHDYFSFELKKRILYKILKKHYPGHSFPNKNLDDLQQIRNLIAHGAIAGRVTGPQKVNPIFRHQGKDHPIKETFEEWDKLSKTVEDATKNLPKIKISVVDAPFELN